MPSTLLERIGGTRARKSAEIARSTAPVPRHLAIVLSGGGPHGNRALRTILRGCMERQVAVLTLLPVDELEEFGAARLEAAPALEEAQEAGVAIHISTARDGREELLEAVRKLAAGVQRGDCLAEALDSKLFEAQLSTGELPAVDLLISTGGGGRLSNVLLWQCAYAELLFLERPWTQFNAADFEAAMTDYAGRCRKFGGLA